MAPEGKITIPPPPLPAPAEAENLASREVAGFEKNDAGMWRGQWPRRMFHWERSLLFFFALGINIWWDKNCLRMLWQSGRANSGFHLDNSVLIALVTTSVANFLALVGIIARDLFTGREKK